MTPARGVAIGLAVALGVYALLALDGRLYWHEARYLYATDRFAVGELLAGRFDPQYGQPLDPQASGAFYLTKLSFLAGLDALWRGVPPERGGLELATALSLVFAALAALLAGALLRRSLSALGASSPDPVPALGAALLLGSPTLAYLGGKLLAEPPALAAALGALLLLDADARGRGGALRIAAGLALHALAVTARVNVGVLAPAYLLALAITLPRVRRRALLLGVALLGVHGLVLAVALAASGVGLAGLAGYWAQFSSGQRGLAVSLLGGAAGLGALLPLALVGLASRRRAVRRLLVIWTLAAGLPTVAVVASYQVEARYLVAPLVPLAGLAALGIADGWDALARRGAPFAARRAAAVALAAGIVAANALALSVLPYEIDRRPLEALLRSPELSDPRAHLLVPWAYSDYHYLATLHPERSIHLVHVPRVEGELAPLGPAWRARMRDWYGDHYRAGIDDLEPLLATGPVYYLAWSRHPPVEAWARRLEGLADGTAAAWLRRLAPTDHADQSWVVEAPELVREPVGERGMYRIERVTRAGGHPRGLRGDPPGVPTGR